MLMRFAPEKTNQRKLKVQETNATPTQKVDEEKKSRERNTNMEAHAFHKYCVFGVWNVTPV